MIGIIIVHKVVRFIVGIIVFVPIIANITACID